MHLIIRKYVIVNLNLFLGNNYYCQLGLLDTTIQKKNTECANKDCNNLEHYFKADDLLCPRKKTSKL